MPPLTSCLTGEGYARQHTDNTVQKIMIGHCGRALLASLLGGCLCSVGAFVPAASARSRPPLLTSHQLQHLTSVPTAREAGGPTTSCTWSRRSAGALRMGLGDALGKAFANEDMGANKMKNPGLKDNLKWCMVTVNGKTVKAVQGQRLRDVVRAAGAKIEYGCEKGDCGTCESIVDGKKIRVCKAIVPRSKDTLTVKTKFG